MTAGLLATDPAALGPYRLLGRLGGGGMGQVYLAESPGCELAAVKVIRPEFAADPEFRVRFTREVANARNVSGMYTALLVDADTEGPSRGSPPPTSPGRRCRTRFATAGRCPCRPCCR